MYYLTVFLLFLLLLIICLVVLHFKFTAAILEQKDKTIEFIVRAEVGEAKAQIYREVSSSLGGMTERVLTAWISQGGVHSNVVTNNQLPYPTIQNGLNMPYSEVGRSDGRTDLENLLENKPIQWVIPDKLKMLGKITTNDQFVTLHELVGGQEVKHTSIIPTKEMGLIPFFKNWYVGACMNKNCVDKFFSSESHAKYCSEKCRKEENRLKGK